MNEVVTLKINEIVIPENRKRREFNEDYIKELALSIKTIGQFQPILVTKSNRLIAGECRIRACKLNGSETIEAIIRSDDELGQSIIEIEENVRRRGFNWKEKVLALEELHNLLVAKYGIGWSEAKTAKEIGLSGGGVCTDLNLAKAIKETPDIFVSCKTQEQALKTLKKFKLDEAKVELALRKTKTDYGTRAKNYLFHADCLEALDKLPDKLCDAMISDPIYGIDVFTQTFQSGDEKASMPVKHTYQDDTAYFSVVIPRMIEKVSRVLKPNSGVVLFTAFMHAQTLIDLLSAQGFRMDPVPAIWVKGSNFGKTNQPGWYFNRNYEYIVYGTRGDYRLNKPGQSNVLNFPGVQSIERHHWSEKPLPLMEELISRMCLGGSVIIDPMAGSASTIIAAIKLGCRPIGIEIDEKSYKLGLGRVADALSAKDAGQVENI